MQPAPIPHYPFTVYDRPFCIWGDPNEVLAKIKTPNSTWSDYYNYILENIVAETTIKNDAENIILRQTYHHALETAFSLIFGIVQAPRHVYAWIFKAQREDITRCVRDVQENKALPYSGLAIRNWEWEGITQAIFEGAEKEFLDNQSTLIRESASDFLDTYLREEYNAIKHGLRIGMGAFEVRVGKHGPEQCSPADDEYNSTILKTSGSRFLSVIPVDDVYGNSQVKPNFALGINSVDWDMTHCKRQIAAVATLVDNLAKVIPYHHDRVPREIILHTSGTYEKEEPNSLGIRKSRLALNLSYTLEKLPTSKDIKTLLGQS